MAKTQAGEPKTGLVVTLVLSILLNIGLGVFAYLGYDGQADFDKKAKDAAKAKQSEEQAKNVERARYLALAAATGVATAEDMEGLSTLAQRSETKDAFARTAKAVDDRFKGLGLAWDYTNAQTKPQSSFLELVEKYKKDTDDARKQADTARRDLDEARKDHESKQNELKRDVAKEREERKKLGDELDNERKRKSSEYLALQSDNEQKTIEINKLVKEKADLESRLTGDIKRRDEQLLGAENRAEKLRQSLPPTDVLQYDQPKGKVLKVVGSTVYIDLGSADGLKPQVTFSILPRDAVGRGAVNRQRKGGIEVVRVIGPHEAEAKLTEIANQYRDPIVSGDLIYNPSWTKGMRTHVAIVGIIDLNGDGIDDNAEFIRSLEKQGIVVDAHLDLRDLTIKGPGMTLKTDYLIVGEKPVISKEARPDDPREQRKIDVTSKIGELEQRAKDLAVLTIPARRYLTLIGFKLPRSSQQADYGASTYQPKVSISAPTTPNEDGKEGK